MDKTNDIRAICNREYKWFLNKSNVIGIALGNKISNGTDTGETCIHVLVEKKLPKSSLSINDMIMPTYYGISTDVIETGKIETQALTSKIRPMQFGYSIGPYNVSLAGTAGCLVTDGRYYFILSNNHVIAGENSYPINTPIMQPARLDGGVYPNDAIANLYKYVTINFSTRTSTPTNYVDAALAYISNISNVSRNIAIVGAVKGQVSPSINLLVKKVGRTTSLTTGKITSTNATVTVGYSNNRTALFKNQILTGGMSSAGDSGSLLLDNSNRAVGLLFAGSSSVTVYNPITTVLNLLGVRLVLG